MSFETEKNKIRKITDKTWKQKYREERQKIKNQIINERIKIYLPRLSVINKIYHENQDWKLMTASKSYEQTEDPNDLYGRQWISWQIEIEKIDERLIPYIKVHIIYRNSTGERHIIQDADIPGKYIPDDVFEEQPFYTREEGQAIFFEVYDLEESEVLKRVVIHAGYHIFVGGNYLIRDPLEAKLLITITNPRNYT